MRLRSYVTVALLGACSGKDDSDDETDTSVPTDSDTDTDTDADTDADTDTDTVVPTFDCADEDGGDTVPVSWTGTTTGVDDSRASYCTIADGGADWTFLFTAPSDGRYVFTTQNDTFIAVLSFFESCNGYEAACDPGAPAELVVPLVAGQQAVIGIDAYDGVSDGPFTINGRLALEAEVECGDAIDDDADNLLDCIDPDCFSAPSCAPVCPDGVLDTLPARVSGSTVSQPNEHLASCDAAETATPDVSYEFVAPQDGRYGFVVETTFDAVLSVLDQCGGDELGCADAFVLDAETIALDLLAGDVAVAVIDGYAGETGDYELVVFLASEVETCDDGLDDDLDGDTDCADSECLLDLACVEDCTNQADDNDDGTVDCVDPQCALDVACASVCPEEVLAGALPIEVEGSNLGANDDNSASCATLAGTSDVTYEFTAPDTATYTFSTLGSTIDTVLYVLDGCGGPELGCNDDQDLAGGVYQSEVSVALTVGQVVIVVVDTYSSVESGPFQLSVQ